MPDINLDQAGLKSTMAFLQQIMGTVSSKAKMDNSEKLSYTGRFASWQQSFANRARMIGGFMYEYVTVGEVHEVLTPYHEHLVNDMMLCTVSEELLLRLSQLNLTGLAALLKLESLVSNITVASAVEMHDRLMNEAYDGSSPAIVFLQKKIDLANDIASVATDRDALLTLSILHSFRQPKIIKHLLTNPLEQLSPSALMKNLDLLCAVADIPFSGEASNALTAEAHVTKTGPACYRCGAFGHNFRQCLSTTLLESWKSVL